VEKVRRLIEFCRKKKIPIIYTQHSIKPDKSNAERGEPVAILMIKQQKR
jgi:nicotinamidase-related amidase